MFEAFEARAGEQRGREAGQPLVKAAEELVSQGRQDFEDNQAAATHEQNLDLLRGLVALDEAVDIPDIIDSFNRVAADIDEYRGWSMAAEPFSWVPFAHLTNRQVYPADGLRAARVWHLSWQSQKEPPKKSPSDTLVALYQRQEEGELLPPRASVVPFGKSRTASMIDQQPQTAEELADTLREDCFLHFEYNALRRMLETPGLLDHPTDQALEFASRTFALLKYEKTDYRSRNLGIYHNDFAGNLSFYRELASYKDTSNAGLVRGFIENAQALITNEFGLREAAATSVAARADIVVEKDAPYQSFMYLESVNRHFRPETKVKLSHKSGSRGWVMGKSVGRVLSHLPLVQAASDQGIIDAHSWEVWTSPGLMPEVRAEIGKRLGDNYAEEATSRPSSSGQPL